MITLQMKFRWIVLAGIVFWTEAAAAQFPREVHQFEGFAKGYF
jgi:hypothetical protein